jgi:hypothetical protein
MAAKAAVDLTGADRLVQDVPPSGAKAQRQDGANGGSSNRALICKPPAWGEPLLESDYAVLALSWITQEIADEAMLRRIDAILGREVIGQKGNRDCSGILFPGYWPGEQYPHSYRIRRDNPDWTESSGKIKAKAKYLGAPGSANRLYIPPGVTPEQLADIKIAIVIVEGEKKALALWRLAHYETKELRFIPIAISGVWNWLGKVGKTGGPKGERLDVKGPIADLDRIPWGGRRVFIVFDANVHTNESVKWARKGICRELTTRAADVKLVNLPKDCGVNGVDDLLATWGPTRVLKLFEASVSGARLHVVVPPEFQSRPEGMYRVTTQGERLSQIQLTNFRAAIITDIRLDDGVETRREFEIDAELMGESKRFTIPASEFVHMNWPIERLGAAAITFPNQREYARAAIQSQALTATQKHIFAHTGWRKVDGRWIFLHASGAICDTGPVSDVNVRLVGPMSRYELRQPAGSDALKSAVTSSLKLIELGPPAISFPLLAATYRAALGNADFAIHLAGATGAFKSEVAALHQQHFGAAMNRLNLPGAWSSTGNALESLAFHAKDALFVIDDFAPQGSSADVARYHAAADRVFRAAGNHAGRSRLDSTANFREPKPPRSLILSTGEDVPRGQSVRARLLILELSKNSIEVAALTAAQKDARAGRYAEAMGGFLQWLARRYEDTRSWLDLKIAEYRARASCNLAHARTPDIVANLQAGFELFLELAEACGAIDGAKRDCLANRCWEALRDAVAEQSKHQTATEPAARFLDLLRSLLSSGRAHLEAREGGGPNRSPETCGWRRDCGKLVPLGDCIGWVEDDDLYLEPTAAFRAAQLVARDSGEVYAISEHTLRKRLHEKGLLASVDEARQTLTVRRSICGSAKSVLHFHRSTILPEVSDGDEDAQ